MESASSIYMDCDPPVCNGKDCQQNAIHILFENMMPLCIHTCQECYEKMYELCGLQQDLHFVLEAVFGSFSLDTMG